MRIAIYPGSFDPITNGHIDIIERAACLFDKIIVAVSRNIEKEKPLFSQQEKIALIRESIAPFSNVSVDSFEGLMVDYAEKIGAVAAIRGRNRSGYHH